ncbi:MAG TPA: hypothetical protein VN681_03085 [Stellaceae bacterium]|nr:hypothetical protein [Stellaceae bacterium]
MAHELSANLRNFVMLSRPPRNLAVAAGLIWSGLFAAAAQDGGRRFVDSSDFVRIAGVVRMADQDRAIITLRVARGYHINANPASQPYLISDDAGLCRKQGGARYLSKAHAVQAGVLRRAARRL